MTFICHAHPSNPIREGFYFTSEEEFESHFIPLSHAFGYRSCDFDIACIAGSPLDQAFAEAWQLTPDTIKPFFKALRAWDAYAKISFIIAVKHHHQSFDPKAVGSASFDISLYFVKSHYELASYFVEHDVLGDMPMVMKAYVDLEAFARDLMREYTKTDIAGETVIYRLNEEVLS
ncbi:hypothetical protein [Roseibium sp. TrichSKD4]|uniref:hypothetical protein n=1 Tax=Roseibium sp. TrichSKD4 TaxID=744980 RepID=UPI00058F48BE|nr:hypothetical protein [Roseibium sp. TrichSKD4]